MPSDAPPPVRFDTRIAVIVRDELAVWQKLNVAAFLLTGIAAAHPDSIGLPYRDGSGRTYLAMSGQPILVFEANGDALRAALFRCAERGVTPAIYTMGMFATNHDAANRAEVAQHATEVLDLAGIALRGTRKDVEKVTKDLRLHG